MEDEHHFLRFGLVGVFLIAVLAILGMVALVTSGMPTSLPPLAHGVAPVSAHEEGNLVGEASSLPTSGGRMLPSTGTHTYIGYEPQDRVLLFTETSRRTRIEVALSLEGEGILVRAGKTYLVRADISQQRIGGVGIAIDTDGDMQHDRKVLPGGSFTLS